MKLLVVFFLFFFTFGFSQDKVWLDANYKNVSEENAVFYRTKPKEKRKGFWIVDFYKNGKKKREGFAKNKEVGSEEFDGVVVEYHTNGETAIKANYKKGKLHGNYRVYFDSGELKSQTKYRKGKKDGVWRTYYKTGKIKTKGKYKNGEKVGVWKTFYKNE